MKKLLLFCLTTVLLMSCEHFHDEPTKSVWAGNLWIIPWVTGLASAFFFYRAYLKSRSGSEQQDLARGTQYYKENVPFYKVHVFKFAVALLIATILIIIKVNADK